MHLQNADKLSNRGLEQAQPSLVVQEHLQIDRQPDRVLQAPDNVDQSHINSTGAELAEDDSQDDPVAIPPCEDARLLANIQGFASALGCSWQVSCAVHEDSFQFCSCSLHVH